MDVTTKKAIQALAKKLGHRLNWKNPHWIKCKRCQVKIAVGPHTLEDMAQLSCTSLLQQDEEMSIQKRRPRHSAISYE